MARNGYCYRCKRKLPVLNWKYCNEHDPKEQRIKRAIMREKKKLKELEISELDFEQYMRLSFEGDKKFIVDNSDYLIYDEDTLKIIGFKLKGTRYQK